MKSLRHIRKFIILCLKRFIPTLCPREKRGKAQDIIIKIYEYFIQHPEQLPDEYKVILEQEDAHRAVCDYVSGMSDYYAIHIFSKIFIPQGWSKY